MNKIIDDKCNNDYLLCLEVSKVLKDYINKHKHVDREFIKKVIDIYLLNDYLDVNYVTTYDADSLGFFDEEDLTININPTSIHEELDFYKDYRRYFNIGDKRLLMFYESLQTIFHELTHVKQFKLTEDNNNDKLISYFNYIYETNYNLYDKELYRYDATERMADTRASYLANLVLSFVYNNKTLGLFKNDELFYLRNKYVVKEKILYSPLDGANSILKSNGYFDLKENIPYIEIEDSTLYDRLRIGYTITNLEYKFLLELRKNILEDKVDRKLQVKELIKRG